MRYRIEREKARCYSPNFCANAIRKNYAKPRRSDLYEVKNSTGF